MMWALAFSVDTAGQNWKVVFVTVFTQRDWSLLLHCGLHHVPSLLTGILMHRIGNKYPSAVMMLIVATIVVSYVIMGVFGVSLQQAQQQQWFWSAVDLATPPNVYQDWSSNKWTLPPMPFSNLWALCSPNVSWLAVREAVGTMASMAFLFLLRSSIHATALKNNMENLVRRIPPKASHTNETDLNNNNSTNNNNNYNSSISPAVSPQNNNGILDSFRNSYHHHRTISEDSEALLAYSTRHRNGTAATATTTTQTEDYIEIRPKPTHMTTEDICKEYGYAMYVVALVGGFGNCPINAVSTTMYAMNAEGAIPQLGSVLLLLLVYLTDFSLVQYVPKVAFSSLLVLGAVELLAIYLVKSFQKTQDWIEWVAVPAILIFSMIMGFVQAVFLGLVVSLFLFVASFWRAGVVKFHATATEVRSRIERSVEQSEWLDGHGDEIQVIGKPNSLTGCIGCSFAFFLRLHMTCSTSKLSILWECPLRVQLR